MNDQEPPETVTEHDKIHHVSGHAQQLAAVGTLLEWSATPTMRGVIGTDGDGVVAIQLNGRDLVRIDLVVGLIWAGSGSDEGDVIMSFEPARVAPPPDAVSTSIDWTTSTGQYKAVRFVTGTEDYMRVWRRESLDRPWDPIATIELDNADNALVVFDEWRIRHTGYTMTAPYLAWVAKHGDARDASALTAADNTGRPR